MKRILKNIILILLLVFMVGTTVFTMYLAGNEANSFQGGQNLQGMSSVDGNGQTPPQMPDSDNQQNGQPPQMPDSDNQQDGQPPQMPDSDNQQDGQPPQMPDSDNQQDGQPPQMPDSDNQQDGQPPQMSDDIAANNSIGLIYYIAFGLESCIIAIIITCLIMSCFNKKSLAQALGSVVRIIIALLLVVVITGCMTFADVFLTQKIFAGQADSGNNQMQAPGASTDVSYSAKTEISQDTEITSGEYISDTSDENAIMATGDIKATLSGITVSKTGDSDGGDTTSFYGTNSAIIAKDGAKLILDNLTLTTDAKGANGVFSYGGSATTNNSSSDGTEMTISNSNITTTKDGSGGIMATGGGVLTAENLTVETSGTSSAAIRTDRGGGTVKVTKGTYTTNGQGSPAVYSTADITVNDAVLVANASEGVVIEGKNSVTLNNCDLTDSNTKLNGQSTTYKNIFLYQSVSGDAAEGTAQFTANECNITTNNGDSFYITNTKALINLDNNTIVNNDTSGNFLRAQKDSWGNSSNNGGDVTLIMSNQSVSGNIVIDSISTLDMTMKSSSYYEGTINSDNSAKSVILTLDDSSKIKLTGDSYVTELNNDDSTLSNIDFNGYTLYVNGQAYSA